MNFFRYAPSPFIKSFYFLSHKQIYSKSISSIFFVSSNMNPMHLLFAGLCWIASSACFAQAAQPSKCTEKMVEEMDSVQGTFTRKFKEKLIVANSPEDRLEFDLKQFNDAIVFSVFIKGAGDCLDENSKMKVKFISGASLLLPMDGKFNCDNDYATFFGGAFGKKKEFRMFLSDEIETVRIETRKSVIDKTRKNFVEVKFTPQQQKEFIERLECLVEE